MHKKTEGILGNGKMLDQGKRSNVIHKYEDFYSHICDGNEDTRTYFMSGFQLNLEVKR